MSSSYKKFIPSIYLKSGRATRSLTDSAILDVDPVALAREYSDGDADGLLVFDQSIGDKEHENTLKIIRRICENVGIPVIGAGHVDRLDDVKKLLYAGCKLAALNFSRPDNVELVREAAERFGREHIAACYRAVDAMEEHKQLISDCIEELILIDETQISDALKIKDTPSILSMPDISLDKVLAYFAMDNVSGITGNAINDNVKQIRDLKNLCAENQINVHVHHPNFVWEDFNKDPQGLLPVVVQEYSTGQVLMVAYMNEEAYNQTVRTGRMTYYSRSRKELWVKGLTSGHFQYVKSLYGDCDMDTLLAKVDQVGAACHTGHHSCFFQTDLVLDDDREIDPAHILEEDYETIMDRKDHPRKGSYTSQLFEAGLDQILTKLGEENTSVLLAAKNGDAGQVSYEIANYLYHMMVLMAEMGIKWSDVTAEIAKREKKPTIE